MDRFAAAAAECADPIQLRTLLADASAELGFDYFALLHHCTLDPHVSAGLRFDNYPADWVEQLVAGNLWRCDPVHLASRRTNAAFAWADLGTIIRVGDVQRRILDRSRRFGVGPGLTVPVNVPGEPSGSCSFAVRQGRDVPPLRQRCAELVGSHAFCAARRLVKARTEAGRPRLSRRQIECLQLVAAGKSDWEIAVILGIHLETARQYVKTARAAYGVTTRTQLAVHGLRDGWLTFDEAIPPFG